MTHFYLRLTLLPIILLTAVVVVIRSQPYDDYEVRQILFPTGCPAPCFMGIRPGVTTMEEAVAILEASEWVDAFEYQTLMVDNDMVMWTWSDQKPKWMSASSRGELRSIQNLETRLVDMITIDDFSQLGVVFSTLGAPDRERISLGIGAIDIPAYYSAVYEQEHLFLGAYLPCNTTQPYIALINLSLGVQTISPSSSPIYFAKDRFPAC
ncbi:MAG: hypothetical protein IT321_21710 [Anaerolineae bacterium]|nr:hypothetical protein [Anaerolineae bacterium]